MNELKTVVADEIVEVVEIVTEEEKSRIKKMTELNEEELRCKIHQLWDQYEIIKATITPEEEKFNFDLMDIFRELQIYSGRLLYLRCDRIQKDMIGLRVQMWEL